MQELLGLLSIASALLVLVLIWFTARPARRSAAHADPWPVERLAAERPPNRERPGAQGPQEPGSERERAQQETGAEEAVKRGASEGAGEEREQGREREEEVEEVASEVRRPETESSGEEVEEELVRQLSETLSLYRQLLEELSRLRSGGGSK